MSKQFYTHCAVFGSKILHRGVRDGIPFIRKEPFSPTLYVPTSAADASHCGVYGDHLQARVLDSPKDARAFIDDYDSFNYKIHGNTNYVSQFINDQYSNNIEYDNTHIRKFIFDIEVDADKMPDPIEAKYVINAISLWDSITDITHQWGIGDYDNDREDVRFYSFQDEKALLTHFISWWANHYPDIVSGWNVEGFDIPYIINRIDQILGESVAKSLSPWKYIRSRTYNMFGKEQTVYVINGIATLDYLDLYKKYTYSERENYRLDTIAHIELGERKISYEEAGTLHNLYRTDPSKFFRYNVKDTDLVKRLDDKMGLIALVVSIAYYSKINYEDVASPVKTWDALIYNHLTRLNTPVPPNRHTAKEEYPGAYVKQPKPGKYDWVMSFDLASLYPSLIRGINIGPDTIIPHNILEPELEKYLKYTPHDFINKQADLSELRAADVSMASNCQFYRRNKQSFMSVMMENLYRERKADKNVMMKAKKALVDDPTNEELKSKVVLYNNRQMAKKILLNSAYGAMANEYFRYFSLENAEAITLSGQVAIQWINRKLNEYFNNLLKTADVDYVIYTDTDGTYVNAAPLVEEFFKDRPTLEIVDMLDRIAKDQLEPFISKSYNELYEYMNHKEQLMIMDREVIADKGIWASKKRYLLRVYDNEGVRYTTPTMKIMGLGLIKSNTPEVCRNKIREALPIILDGTNNDLISYIDEFKKEWKTLPIEQMAVPMGVSNVEKYVGRSGKWYVKGTPQNSKASIIFNKLAKTHNLNEIINGGDKIKIVQLKLPNPIGETVVGFLDFLPPEFGLTRYVDTDAMFQKAFISPMEDILDAISWETVLRASLEDFM